jgi:hypothetical protein
LICGKRYLKINFKTQISTVQIKFEEGERDLGIATSKSFPAGIRSCVWLLRNSPIAKVRGDEQKFISGERGDLVV